MSLSLSLFNAVINIFLRNGRAANVSKTCALADKKLSSGRMARIAVNKCFVCRKYLEKYSAAKRTQAHVYC